MSSSSLFSARSIRLLRPLKDVTVTAGETATFECELSYDGIAVDWFLGEQKMEASERVSQMFVLVQLVSNLQNSSRHKLIMKIRNKNVIIEIWFMLT